MNAAIAEAASKPRHLSATRRGLLAGVAAIALGAAVGAPFPGASGRMVLRGGWLLKDIDLA